MFITCLIFLLIQYVMIKQVTGSFWLRLCLAIDRKLLISEGLPWHYRATSCSPSLLRTSTGYLTRHARHQHSQSPRIQYDYKPAWADRYERRNEEARRLQHLYSYFSTEELEEQLENAATRPPDVLNVITLLQVLYHDRQTRPTASHYRCLILAQADAKHGSCETVENILHEMERDGFELDSGHLHAGLKVLAVHPNYVLRAQLINRFRSKSIPLLPNGWHDLATALIRERQLELAMHTVEEMEAQQIRVQLWLRGLLAYSLCDSEDFQAAVEVASTIPDNRDGGPLTMWGYFLDAASTAYHYPTVSFVWNKIVEPQRFNPSTGTCLNILTTAARAGDTHLATSVFKILGGRRDVLTLTEYEALIDAYIRASNPESALRVLCTLRRVNVEPEDGSTRSLVSFLGSNDEYPPSSAWSYLRSFTTADAASSEKEKEGGLVAPIALLNAIIEAHLDRGHLRAAQDVYRHRTVVCPSPPNLRTFHLLLRAGFALRDAPQVHEILYQRMPAFDVMPDARCYELAILTAVAAKEFRAAHEYLVEFRETGAVMNGDAWEMIAGFLEGEDGTWAIRLKEELRIAD